MTKTDIRQLSAQLGLPTADKPQMACLSSRVPYGEAVTEQKLSMIEQAEALLRDLGFYDVRVRHHELRLPSDTAPARAAGDSAPDAAAQALSASKGRPPSPVTHLARIEVGPVELRKFLENGHSTTVAEALKKIGYTHVTLDLQGYRRGGADEAVNRRGAQSTAPAKPG